MNSRLKKIIVIAEYSDDRPAQVTLELITCAREIRKIANADIQAVVMGVRPESAAQILSLTGTDVVSIEIDVEKEQYPLFQRRILESAMEELKPDIIIAAHTSMGMDFLPGLAVSMGASCITGVKKITVESGQFVFVRSVWNGKFDAMIRSEKAVTAVSVPPGSFKPADGRAAKKGTVSLWKNSDIAEDRRIRIESVEKKGASSDSSLDDADVIVSAGRGIGKEENLEVLREFAGLLRKSAVAGSRPLIDCGWLPYRRQVGVTGKTVSPKIYIACGVSGSSQHIAGMAGSETIIAVNTDPGAAIFNISDFCVIEDVVPFMEALVKLISTSESQGC